MESASLKRNTVIYMNAVCTKQCSFQDGL